MGKLRARQVATLGPGKHEDGEGLRLVVSPTGSRRWVVRVTVKGKRRELGLGPWPRVSLADARGKAAEFREHARIGVDPTAPPPPSAPTFSTVARDYIDAHSSGWRNAKHAAQWVSTLAAHAEPALGALPIDRIGTEDVLRVLTPIWSTTTETAKRVQGRIENVLDFAAAKQLRDPANPARWRGHLDKLLPKPGKVKRVEHHPAMPYGDVPSFIVELAKRDSVSALALRFLILTAARTGEVIGATWGEIDLEAAAWTIPAARMKAKREHRVPLTAAALVVLDALPRIVGNPYLFPGSRPNLPIGSQAMAHLMKAMGYGVGGSRGDYVPHGFRSAFRDWAGEVSLFPRDVCEMALAHVIGNKAEAAYRRGDLFEKRRQMMDAWADWCSKKPSDNSLTCPT